MEFYRKIKNLLEQRERKQLQNYEAQLKSLMESFKA